MSAQHAADFACRLCGGNGLVLCYTLGREGEFRYYRCPTCKLVNYDLANGLDQEQYTEFIDPCDDSAPRNRDKDASWRFIERHLPVPRRFLDIGCGPGRMLYLAKRAGAAVTGLELSAEMAEHAHRRTGAVVVVADFLRYEPDPGERFDLVCLRHVLEHLPDSVLAMTKVNGLLEDGGHALLEFPNIDATDKRLKRFLVDRGLHKRRFKPGFHAGHCNEFCKESFSYLLAKTGFSLVCWETYSFKTVPNFILNRIHVGNKARTLVRKECDVAELRGTSVYAAV